MHFIRMGEYLAASRVTGPRHNLLMLRLESGVQAKPICECLPPRGGSTHEPLNEAEVVASILEGVAEANKRLSSNQAVTHVRYVANDTKPEAIYRYLALKILEHLHSGGEFAEAPPRPSEA